MFSPYAVLQCVGGVVETAFPHVNALLPNKAFPLVAGELCDQPRLADGRHAVCATLMFRDTAHCNTHSASQTAALVWRLCDPSAYDLGAIAPVAFWAADELELRGYHALSNAWRAFAAGLGDGSAVRWYMKRLRSEPGCMCRAAYLALEYVYGPGACTLGSRGS